MARDSYTNFRVRGIPERYQIKAHVRKLVRNVLDIGIEIQPIVCSLTSSPVKQGYQVATLRFSKVPEVLSDDTRSEWKFDIPYDGDADYVDDDADEVPKRLIFDTHFLGFTPLQSGKDSDYEIE